MYQSFAVKNQVPPSSTICHKLYWDGKAITYIIFIFGGMIIAFIIAVVCHLGAISARLSLHLLNPKVGIILPKSILSVT
jgi:hypothetical protein